jgi:predicted nucleic acid-binding protein
MARYADTPMDLADASLIVAADALNATRIFSLDSDFYIYRLANGAVLEVLPGPAR